MVMGERLLLTMLLVLNDISWKGPVITEMNYTEKHRNLNFFFYSAPIIRLLIELLFSFNPKFIFGDINFNQPDSSIVIKF